MPFQAFVSWPLAIFFGPIIASHGRLLARTRIVRFN